MEQYQHINVDSSLGPVGAEVSGVDLSQPLEPEVVKELHQAWLAHHVLFFHDQDMSPTAQEQFAANFGELDQYKFMQAVDENPYVIPIVKEADATLNFGGGWHTDSSYQAIPPKATVLYAVEVPEEGGDTMFANATAAFEALSPGMKENLLRWQGVYSPKLVHGLSGFYKSEEAEENLGNSYGGDDGYAETEVVHPLIRTHAETGEKSIYCGLAHTVNIDGWSREDSLPIFRHLTDHLTQDQFVTRFKWGQGSLAMWDNRCVFHYALNDYHGQRREMHRVTIKGEKPA
jgi:taurine dioxygenase